MMKNILAGLYVLMLSACATGYHRSGATGGFSETQLDENVFTVTFKGNAYTARDKADDFALLRSAELALENGYKYFVIVDANKYEKTSTYRTPITATTNFNTNTYGSLYNYGNSYSYGGNTSGNATTIIYGGQTYNISKPRTSNTIVCFKDKPDGFSYNAVLIASSLKKKHGIKESGDTNKDNVEEN